MAKKFYITSAIPYVNAAPHIGHALEFVQTDCIARYHTLIGDDVLTLCGGDENALKNVQAAENANIPVQEFVDTNNKLFEKLATNLNARYDVWQKGSDRVHHFPSSQKLWDLCAANIGPERKADIYKESYEGLYCVGCETFYEPEELNELGECFEHPGKPLERVKEKNWFFRLSRYQERLIRIIQGEDKEFHLEIVPEKRKNEVLSFLKRGLNNISISRSNERAKNWGVPVPGDPTQRMYVWFDALNIYQSGIGFGWDEEKYDKWWAADVHVIGKGITRFHAVYWPAFLLSAGLKLPKKIYVHDYFTVNGQKMSKTLGNVIDPVSVIEKYGVDPLRYYFLAQFSPFNDGDFSEEEFKKTYNADLANGLGNLVARIAQLSITNNIDPVSGRVQRDNQLMRDITPLMDQFRFDRALELIWGTISGLDKYLEKERPWGKIGSEQKKVLGKIVVITEAISSLLEIAEALQPFLPQTSEKILKQFSSQPIQPQPPLFPRLS